MIVQPPTVSSSVKYQLQSPLCTEHSRITATRSAVMILDLLFIRPDYDKALFFWGRIHFFRRGFTARSLEMTKIGGINKKDL